MGKVLKIGTKVRISDRGGMDAEHVGKTGTIRELFQGNGDGVLPNATVYLNSGHLIMCGLYQLDAHFSGWLPLNDNGEFDGVNP